MNAYPAVDPIPLPAPVWLLKLLHIVTLSLHFVAVEMLLGGLLLAIVFSLFSKSAHSLVAARATWPYRRSCLRRCSTGARYTQAAC